MVKLFTFLFSLVLSIFTSSKCNVNSKGMHILIAVIAFFGFAILCVALFFIVAFFFSFFLSKTKKQSEYDSFYHKVYTTYGYIVLSLFGVKIKLEGMEKLPKDVRYLVIQNHVSNVDPIVLNYVLRKEPLIFVSKESLFNIPFFGKMIRKMGYVSLKRDNSREDIKEINRGIKMMGEGLCSVAIYPEGTRNKNPKEVHLQEFKPGSFNFATKNKSPIVITSISGTENINKGLLIRRHKVILKIVDVIDYEDYQGMTTKEISDIAYQKMSDSFEYHKI